MSQHDNPWIDRELARGDAMVDIEPDISYCARFPEPNIGFSYTEDFFTSIEVLESMDEMPDCEFELMKVETLVNVCGETGRDYTVMGKYKIKDGQIESK